MIEKNQNNAENLCSDCIYRQTAYCNTCYFHNTPSGLSSIPTNYVKDDPKYENYSKKTSLAVRIAARIACGQPLILRDVILYNNAVEEDVKVDEKEADEDDL